MHSEELLSIYQDLSAKYRPTVWLEPLGVSDHLETLKRILLEDQGTAFPSDFSYNRQTIEDYCADWTAFLELLTDADMSEPVCARVKDEVQDKLDRASALASGSDDLFVNVEQSQVGLPSSELVATAKAILDGDLSVVPFAVRTTGKDDEDLITSAQMRARMAAALTAYGLDDWTAEEDSTMTAKASVSGPLRRVRVRAGTTFTPASANRLLAHEIGGHILRWANSQVQSEPWVAVPLGRTVPTEEGMATWREVEFGLLAEEQLRVYAARVLAAEAALQEGLVGVARQIAPYVGVQNAAEIAIRSKRGLSNPNGPGGQIKDWGYLAGLLTIADLAKNNEAGLRLLTCVKWPVEDLPLIVELHQQGRIDVPHLLPDAGRLGLLGL